MLILNGLPTEMIFVTPALIFAACLSGNNPDTLVDQRLEIPLNLLKLR